MSLPRPVKVVLGCLFAMASAGAWCQSVPELEARFQSAKVPDEVLRVLAEFKPARSFPVVRAGAVSETSIDFLDKGEKVRKTEILSSSDGLIKTRYREPAMGQPRSANLIQESEEWLALGGLMPVYRATTSPYAVERYWLTRFEVKGDYETFMNGDEIVVTFEALKSERYHNGPLANYTQIKGSTRFTKRRQFTSCADEKCQIFSVNDRSQCTAQTWQVLNAKISASSSNEFCLGIPIRFIGFSPYYGFAVGASGDMNAGHLPAWTGTDRFVHEAEAAQAAVQAAVVDRENTRKQGFEKSASLSEAERLRARLLFESGLGFLQAGEFAAAAIAFNRGLAVDPANAAAHFYLGEANTLRKRLDLAKVHYEDAIYFAPKSTEALIADARLRAR